MEHSQIPIWQASRHKGGVNSVDGIGGGESGGMRVGEIGESKVKGRKYGGELGSGGADKQVLVWDFRQKEKPVCSFEGKSECWGVSFGEEEEERRLGASFSDGTVSVFDLRANKLFSQFSFPNSKGVCIHLYFQLYYTLIT